MNITINIYGDIYADICDCGCPCDSYDDYEDEFDEDIDDELDDEDVEKTEADDCIIGRLKADFSNVDELLQDIPADVLIAAAIRLGIAMLETKAANERV